MINITPDPIAFTIGNFPVHWYGICYAVGLAAVYFVLVHEARRRGEDPEIVGNALIIVAIAALIGGRLYHVIDQWALYRDDLITAILPISRPATAAPADTTLGAVLLVGGLIALAIGVALRSRDGRAGVAGLVLGVGLIAFVFLRYVIPGGYAFSGFTGLGVPGGIITGTIAAWLLTRHWNLNFWVWADIVAPALFVMQAIGRLGNFFNQELYGPPTNLPWGIAIDCAHRVAAYPCSLFPADTTFFQPLFLYESLSGLLGAITLLWLARHAKWLVPGDLLGIFFIWYGSTRFVLESLRSGNWTFFGIPTAQLVTLGFIVFGAALIWYRHGPGRPRELADDDDAADLDDLDEFDELDDEPALEPDIDASDTAAGTNPGASHRPDAPPA
jgi:prolipoprotein diacylglyceryl transferase